jgi:predicted ArsR family transcriptional regulator
MAEPPTVREGVTAHDDAPTAFTAAVSAITDAFGDPTRRRIYLFTRDHAGPEGVTASAVATEVGVHPNVARHHLDKLAAGGYVEVVGRTSGGAAGARRAGRPSKRYVAVATNAFDAGVPVRSDDLVLALLGRALDRLPQHEAEAMAEEVGATYGRAMAAGLTGDALAAGQRSLRSAMQAVADALTAHGFAAHMAAVDAADGGAPSALGAGTGLRIINDHCPFGTVANDHPVVCAVDRGLVRGMLSALYGDGDAVDIAVASSKARGDTICSTAV